MMIDVEVFVGGGWILWHDGYRRRSDCVVDERRTDNDTADNADGRKPKPDIEEISDAVLLEDWSHAGQSAVSACERHLDERSRLAVDSEYGFEQEPDEDPAECQLAHCHHPVHDYVRARDAPDRLEGWRWSSNRSEADIAMTSRPGICLQTANTLSGKSPLPPRSRPIPSGPRPRTRKPPITAVGMKSLRNNLDQRRMSAAPAKTTERMTSEKPISSALPCMLSSLACGA